MARREYNDPATWNVVTLGPLALLNVITSNYWFALVIGVLILIRIWGMRPGGYLRRGLQRKYGWD